MRNMTPRGIGGRARSRGAVIGLLAACLAVGALAGCSSDTGVAPQVIAGGTPAGVYHAYGEVLSAQLRAVGHDTAVVETGGSVDNLMRVGRGEAALGFAQADAAADAVAGTGAFAEPLPISGVARVYDEYLQVVVPAGSHVQELSDLSGLRVSVGEAHSGVRVIADRVLRAAGMGEGDVQSVSLGLDASIAALAGERIDAFFWVGGVPTPGIAELSSSTPVRMLPIRPETLEKVNSGHAGVYRLSQFPLGSYGTAAVVETMTIPNYLVANTATSDDFVFEVARMLFEQRDELAGEVPAAAFLDRRQAIFTSPVPLHPGAEEYYVTTRTQR